MIRRVCATVAVYIFSLHWLILAYLSKIFRRLGVFLHCFLIRNAYGQKLIDFSYVPAALIFRLELVLKMEVESSFETYVDFYTASQYLKQYSSQRCENPNFLRSVCLCS